MFFSVSHHIPGPTMFVSHFPRLSVFSTFSRSYNACVSFYTFFRFLALFQVLECTFLILQGFDSFSKYFRSYNICDFTRFSVFLAIFHLLPCEFLICVCQFSRHMSCPTVYIYHFHVFQCFSPYSRTYHVRFSFSTFVSFLAIFQVLQCVCLIFQVISLLSPYARYYSVHLSFFIFFSVSRHIPDLTM